MRPHVARSGLRFLACRWENNNTLPSSWTGVQTRRMGPRNTLGCGHVVKGWPWGWAGLSGGSLGRAFAPETGRSFVLVSLSPAFLLGNPRLSGVALGLSPSSTALAVWPQGQGWLLSLNCVEGNVCPQGQRLEVPSSGRAVGATTREKRQGGQEEGGAWSGSFGCFWKV